MTCLVQFYTYASIHFPLAREDDHQNHHLYLPYASIHFPLAREDIASEIISTIQPGFNPLPSCEGRRLREGRYGVLECFNPLPSCEGRLNYSLFRPLILCFNPLPSCEGRRIHRRDSAEGRRFNPLPSCEGRQYNTLNYMGTYTASIHFPLAREDCPYALSSEQKKSFNPLPSCEGRLSQRLPELTEKLLQSTSLLRGKTSHVVRSSFGSNASIHFPLAREDNTLSNFENRIAASIHFPLAREDFSSIWKHARY